MEEYTKEIREKAIQRYINGESIRNIKLKLKIHKSILCIQDICGLSKEEIYNLRKDIYQYLPSNKKNLK